MGERAEHDVGASGGFNAAEAQEHAAELLTGPGAGGEVRDAEMPTTAERFTALFVVDIAKQADEIVAHADAMRSNPNLPPLRLREVAAAEISRFAGDDPAERSRLTEQLLEKLIADFQFDDDPDADPDGNPNPELRKAVFENIFDNANLGRDSLFNQLSFEDGAKVVARSLLVTTESSDIPANFTAELDRRIGQASDLAQKELTDFVLEADAREAFTVLRGLEHTGGMVAAQISGFDASFNAIGEVITAAEQHRSPLVSEYAWNARSSLQVEYVSHNSDVSDDNRGEFFPESVEAQIDHNRAAYKELKAQRVEVEGTVHDAARLEASGIHPVRVASDAVGYYNDARQLSGVLKSTIRELDGRLVVPLDGYDGSSDFFSPETGLDELYVALQEPTVRKTVEDHLGVPLSEVSYSAQQELLQFMAGANRETYDRLGQLMLGRPELGADFLESFLALEQGKTFGESLLNLAERLKPADLQELLAPVAMIREMSARLEQSRSSVDSDMARSEASGLLRRTTEVLMAAEQLVVQGPYGMEVNGLQCEITDIEQIQTQLEQLSLVAQGVAADGPVTFIKAEGEPQVYLVATDPPTFEVTRLREAERGGQDPQWERGKAPRVNRHVVVDGESLPSDLRTVDLAFLEAHTVSFRIDFQDGKAALDIGGKVKTDRSAPDWQLAEVISVGAALHAQERGVAAEDYHVQDLPDVTEEEFRAFVARERENMRLRQAGNGQSEAHPPDQGAA